MYHCIYASHFSYNHKISILTESLLEIQVSTSPGEVCVECFFTSDSTAYGCHIKALSSANAINSIMAFNVTTDRQTPSCLIGLDNGTYVIKAVEIDKTGTIGTQEITKTVNVEKEADIEMTVSVDVIAGTVLSGGIGLVLLVTTTVVCVVLLRRKKAVAKSSLGNFSFQILCMHT